MTIKASYPTIEPTLNLDFANSKRLDPRVTFTRNSVGTYFDAAGVLRTAAVNEPRFDHDPVTGESLGLLVEGQGINLLLRSEEFDNAYWFTTGVTVTVNQGIAPDGSLTADLLTTDGAPIYPAGGTTVTASTQYSFSFYVKLGTMAANQFKFAIYCLSSSSFIAADVTPTEVLSSTSFTRVRYTFTTPAGCTSVRVYPFRNGATITAGSSFYLWGAQLEAGAFPTSYIKTSGTTITRQADTAVMTGTNFSSWYRQDEGTVLCDAIPTSTGGNGIAGFDDTTNDERWRVGHTGTTAGGIVVVDGGVVQANLQTAANGWPVNTAGRIAVAIQLNNSAVSVNGQSALEDLNCTIPTVTQMTIGTAQATGYANARIRRLLYWNTRLPNATLQALTAA